MHLERTFEIVKENVVGVLAITKLSGLARAIVSRAVWPIGSFVYENSIHGDTVLSVINVIVDQHSAVSYLKGVVSLPVQHFNLFH